MRKSIQRNEAVINRIRRVPFVVFLKKILPVIIFLLLLSLFLPECDNSYFGRQV